MATASISDVEFIFLGTGTSSGVPVIGCDCRVCTSDDPRDARSRCAAAIRFTDGTGQPRTIFIDASPDLRMQVLRHRIDRCDAILFTHYHVDHTFGLDDTRRFNAVMRAPINIYADAETMRHLNRVYTYIFERERNINDSFVATLVPHLIDAERPVDLHGLRFTPLRFLHGRLEILGYRIDALDRRRQPLEKPDQPPPLPLVWATDVSGIPPQTWPHLGGLRTLALDMLRYRQHPTHFCVDDATTTAEQIGADQTWFIHMTHDIMHAELDAELPPRLSLAWDGLVLKE